MSRRSLSQVVEPSHSINCLHCLVEAAHPSVSEIFNDLFGLISEFSSFQT
jgi:hypothetical protein